MDWGSFTLGAGGLLIGALSLFLNYKSRSSAHREFLYQKQVEAYNKIFNSIHPFYNSCLVFIFQCNFKLDNTTRPQLREETAREYEKFISDYRAFSLFLSKPVHAEINNFIKVFNAISSPNENSKLYPKELINSQDPQMDLSKAYSSITSKMRESLGIEPLSEDILKVVGGREN
jgi:hypothetical protein